MGQNINIEIVESDSVLFKRPGGRVWMKFFHYEDVKAEDAEEGASKMRVRWLITKALGAENFAMRMFEMEAGGCSPLHSHPWEHEVFILEGEGIVVGEEGERRFRAGDVVFIPPGERHQFKNNGASLVKFLCVIPYTPEYVAAHKK